MIKCRAEERMAQKSHHIIIIAWDTYIHAIHRCSKCKMTHAIKNEHKKFLKIYQTRYHHACNHMVRINFFFQMETAIEVVKCLLHGLQEWYGARDHYSSCP